MTANHLLLSCVSWQEYESIGEALRDRRSLRLTYHKNRLEVFIPTFKHITLNAQLNRLVLTLTLELSIDISSGGSTTLKHQNLCGIEPDLCYWIEHESQMRGREEYNPTVDPPPDLALEIEVSRTILDRLAILAALRVPEVWRSNGDTVQVLLLSPEGTYIEV
jgi:Uma2 family endonuclease